MAAPEKGASLFDHLLAIPQYLLPHHLLCRVMYRVMRVRWRPWKNAVIRWFSGHFGVDMSCAAQSDPRAYPHFNAFFTRALAAGARPLATEATAIACPVDGTVSQVGNITDGCILQAKGRSYTVTDLLGGDTGRAARFSGGSFTTLYLSPRDYHRVHAPYTGKLNEMIYVPGRLFSVSPSTTRAVPNLFARNERLAAIFETDAGPMAVVMVGALFVGSMETVWSGQVTPPRPPWRRQWNYRATGIELELAKGDELGRFNMGSTVIVLFGGKQVEWSPELQPGESVRMGRKIGTIPAN